MAASGRYRREKTTLPTDGKVPPAKLARAVERLRYHLDRVHHRLVPPSAAMLELIFGAWISQAITAAAELGIADALADGPQTSPALRRRRIDQWH